MRKPDGLRHFGLGLDGGARADFSKEDLAFADRAGLTPLLTRVEIPEWARSHVEGAFERNAVRAGRVAAAYEEIAPAFDHLLLKGVTHVPDFVDDVRLRVQYDLDLYVPPEQKERARDALVKIGYEPIGGTEGLAMDHLPTMVRKTGWQWRGDYFDPDLPVAVEVHFQFWDEATERLRVEGLGGFWERREGNRLALPDRLGYAALHLTRHLLRGNVRPIHVWEIARFLHTHRDDAFWEEWRRTHPASLRRIEAVGFELARRWFGCWVPEPIEEAVGRWFDRYAWSPLESGNKHELWLHMSLLESAGDRASVLRRRLIPMALPGPVDAVHLPREQMTFARRIVSVARNGGYAISRGWHHARLLLPTLWEGLRYFRG